VVPYAPVEMAVGYGVLVKVAAAELVVWSQCGSWVAAWLWSLVAGRCLVAVAVVAACGGCASYPVCGAWPPVSRGSQLPGALGMTAGGPRQPSLVQCRANDSEDWSLWTKCDD
jgi:hypothetical protein